MRFLDPKLKMNYSFLEKLIKLNGYCLQYIPDVFKNDFDLLNDQFGSSKKQKIIAIESILENIYNEPLKKCGTSSMSSGSWDSQGKCSELGGGVHQICVKNLSLIHI